MDETLSHKSVKGVSWNFIETISIYASRFVIGIILARLLFPADFGLIGMIAIFISVSDVFVNAGFGQAFIQKKDASLKDANTVFLINFLLGVVIYGILYFSAPLIADFFNERQLVALIRVLSIVIIINSLNVIQQSLIRKEFQFRKRAVLTVIATLISGIVGIICAYKGMGVWSLVIQQLTNRFVLCVLLYIKSQWKLTFSYSHDSAKALFSIGGWMLCGNLVLTMFNNLYRFAIGKLYSDVELGLYERAKQFESMIADTFTMVLGNVSFPVFSKIQDAPSELQKAISNFVKFSCLLIYPILSCLLVVAEPFISWIITDKWLSAVPYLKLLCIVGFFVPLNFFIGQLLQAIGKSKEAFYYTIVLSLLRVLNVAISYCFGVKGIIIGEGIVLIVSTVLMSMIMRPMIKFSYINCFKATLGIALASIIIIAAGATVLAFLSNFGNIVRTFVPVWVMGMIYFCWLLLFEKATIHKAILIFRK